MKTMNDLYQYGEEKGMRRDSREWNRFWIEICEVYGMDPDDPDWEIEEETYDDICDEVDVFFEI